MNKLISDPVLNSNSLNFLDDNYRQKEVHQIQPDKFTFLKSNLIISNILNRNISKQKKNCSQKILPETQDLDAYINCQVQMKILKQERIIQKSRNQKVRNLAKCRSQMTFNQFKTNQKNVNDMISNVYLLRRQMTQKAAQIMGKKQDNSYMGRNLLNKKQNFLKQMRETNPTQKGNKVQTTRLVMKQTAKRFNQQQYKQSLNQTMNNQSFRSKGSCNSSSMNCSYESTLTDNSYSKAVENKIQSDDILRRLIKNKSQENFEQEQRRKAVWDGFSTHWRKGCEKGIQHVKQLKKKAQKKNIKPKFQTSEHSILNYYDQFSRQVALKKYQNAFQQTVSTFQLKLK